MMHNRYLCFVVIIVMILSIAGCQKYEGPYTFFRQEHGNIEKIEICAYDHHSDTRTTVTTLAKKQEESFLTELSHLQCKTYAPGDHSRSYGRFQICITYLDGEIELIGPYNIGYITAKGIACLTNYYPASEQQLWDLVARYVDENTLAQLK